MCTIELTLDSQNWHWPLNCTIWFHRNQRRSEERKKRTEKSTRKARKEEQKKRKKIQLLTAVMLVASDIFYCLNYFVIVLSKILLMRWKYFMQFLLTSVIINKVCVYLFTPKLLTQENLNTFLEKTRVFLRRVQLISKEKC